MGPCPGPCEGPGLWVSLRPGLGPGAWPQVGVGARGFIGDPRLPFSDSGVGGMGTGVGRVCSRERDRDARWVGEPAVKVGGGVRLQVELGRIEDDIVMGCIGLI